MKKITRRHFIGTGLLTSAGFLAYGCKGVNSDANVYGQASKKQNQMRFGLVTYMWGADWDLDTLIRNCEKNKITGVELRTGHAHGVEPSINDQRRREVKKRFADSAVTLVGLGSNECYDSPDPKILSQAIDSTRAYIKLSHDIGGSGVKVKPNAFHDDIPHEVTIAQIGRSLNDLGPFAADYNQQIRLEVHGTCAHLPTIKKIMDVVVHPNVKVCWNSNDEDLEGEGLEYNFNLVKNRLGDTVHIRELNIDNYPYQQLMNLLSAIDYRGWILLEARTQPADRIAAIIEQRELWEQIIAKAKSN
jgi:sugar phosphate isomerase/epimerase